jgi:quercetin dioxygenase-like cupin family protein
MKAMDVRRVLTGHDEDGKAGIVSDKVLDNVMTMKSGNRGALVWAADDGSVDGEEDTAYRKMGIAPAKGGSVFRFLELPPGKSAFMHCTDTIDYCIILEGECVMLLDDNVQAAMQPHDVVVQRGTWHGWENRSDAPCRLAVVLISASPPARRQHEAL